MMLRSHDRFHSENGRRQILVVDDEFINRELLGNVLQSEYEVLYAADGREGLKAAREHRDTLSLILLDLMMPEISGTEMLQRLKQDPDTARIPVIVLTSEQAAEVEILGLGAIDFIPKPYPQSAVILARVRRTIELSEDREIIRTTERDPLTGLYNREFFYRYAEQFDQHHRQMEMDAIVLDIHHFRMLNERFGTAYGDGILRDVGGRVRDLVADSGGIVCRREADTFLVYCPHRTDYETFLADVTAGLPDGGAQQSRVRLRMGVYSVVDKEIDIERRFDRAKIAADTVRNSVTRTVAIYDNALHDKELYEERLVEDFHRAIREEQFQVYYQPKFDVRPEIPFLTSAEALVRWVHPELGMISPGIFVPLFEDNGLVQELDIYVWEHAAAQIEDWKSRFGFIVPVSVNVSRIDILDPNLIGTLQRILSQRGLHPTEFLLEITESAYTQDSEQIIETVNRLRDLGFRIEMDDFGTGYSSLNMISSLPIDALKLDMQFIRNAFRERKDTRLLEAMIQLAESFEVPTIAEGVETAEQVFTLKAMGCDIIQGYYFSRPLPAEEFEAYLLENRPDGTERWSKGMRPRRDRFTYNALHDSLTGLYNYSAFDILFHDSDHDHIAVLIAEIENYAGIKRDKGRSYTDRVVCHIAGILRKNFRSVDHICRLQENEFAVIMTRVTSESRNLVFSKIERVNEELKEGTENLAPVTLSVGVAFSDRERPDGDVFQDADTALKRLKEMKQTGYAVY